MYDRHCCQGKFGAAGCKSALCCRCVSVHQIVNTAVSAGHECLVTSNKMSDNAIVRTHGLAPGDSLASSCHASLCTGNLKCARDCLAAAAARSHDR